MPVADRSASRSLKQAAPASIGPAGPHLEAGLRRRWERLRASRALGPLLGLRAVVLTLTFAGAVIALSSGVQLSERGGLPEAGLLTRLYYAAGLFVLAGIDLGMPKGGPAWGRTLLWVVYFAAPTITAGAVIEGALKVLRPHAWRLRRLRGHTIISGGSRLALLYLRRLRRHDPHTKVVVVDPQVDELLSPEAREIYRVETVKGEIHSAAVLDRVRVHHARRVALLSDRDLSNLDAATHIVSRVPELQAQTVIHVSDLRFLQAVSHTLVARNCSTFNAHQIAARHLVETQIARHFEHTLPRDRVVLAGFGRFGQTLLDELQRRAAGRFECCVIIDSNAERHTMEFDDEVGFDTNYRREVLEGDVLDVRIWRALDQRHHLHEGEPIVVVGAGDDETNLRAALWVKAQWPNTLVIARSFSASRFTTEAAEQSGIQIVNVADLLLQSMPDGWFAAP